MSEGGTGTSSFMKAAIVVFAGVVVLSALIGVAGYIWWKKNESKIKESTLNAREEGLKIGQSLDEQQCFDLAVSRVSNKSKLTEMISNGLFLGSCLQASKPTKDFCKDVPADTDFLKTFQWRKKRCEQLKLEQNVCSGLLSVVQQHCHIKRKHSDE